MKPRCKICGHQVQALWDEACHLDYFLCPHCEYIFQNDGYLSARDEKAVYDCHENTGDNAGYIARFNELIQACHLPDQSTISLSALDYGSGPEPVLACLLRKQGMNVSVYDLYYAPDESCFNKKYDLITMTEVAEHLKEPMEVFSKLIGLLKFGGKLAVMTQFHPLNSRDFLRWWYRRDPTHIGFFRQKTFSVMAMILGLNLFYCDHQMICVCEKK